jgi:hypothetical protein
MSSEPATNRTINQHPPGMKPVGQTGGTVSAILHRVCIQCNNMFQVTPDKFDVKQCPNCHKG